jgi:urease accessory protein
VPSLPLPLLLLTDSRFPAGGYAHSGGLEAAVEAGLGAGEVGGFLIGRLRGVGAPEAHLVAAAVRATDLEGLLALDLEATARCPSPPLRAAAGRLGAQLLRTAATVWPEATRIGQYRAVSSSTPRPVAFGIVAAVAGLDAYEAAFAYLYEDASSVTTAAVRLLPLDSAAAARMLVEAEPEIERLAAEAASAQRLPGGFAPALELGSLAHAAREARLFAS